MSIPTRVASQSFSSFLRSAPVEVYPLAACLGFACGYGIFQSMRKFHTDQNL
ncbi:375_t:CDS:1, partial [Ambispora leptoticha]